MGLIPLIGLTILGIVTVAKLVGGTLLLPKSPELIRVEEANRPVICVIPDRCGGGEKPLKKWECDSVICCEVKGKWELYHDGRTCETSKLDTWDIFEKINEYREEKGKAFLEYDSEVCKVAKRIAQRGFGKINVEDYGDLCPECTTYGVNQESVLEPWDILNKWKNNTIGNQNLLGALPLACIVEENRKVVFVISSKAKVVAEIASEPKIDCIGPDGKHLTITQKECDLFNDAWKNVKKNKQNQPSLVTSTYSCTVSYPCTDSVNTYQLTSTDCQYFQDFARRICTPVALPPMPKYEEYKSTLNLPTVTIEPVPTIGASVPQYLPECYDIHGTWICKK